MQYNHKNTITYILCRYVNILFHKVKIIILHFITHFIKLREKVIQKNSNWFSLGGGITLFSSFYFPGCFFLPKYKGCMTFKLCKEHHFC